MREVFQSQMRFGEVAISDIEFDVRSRDEIPKLLIRPKVFAALTDLVPANINPNNGRRGMDLWKILVLGTLRLSCNWDYDKLMEIANNHLSLRLMLGHSIMDNDFRYALQTLKDNVSLFTPEILDKINQIVLKYGHEIVGMKPGEKLNASCDSFVLETDVHYPTDINILWDAMRKTILSIVFLCVQVGLPGWRKSDNLLKKTKKLFRKAQLTKRSTSKNKEKKAKREQLIIAAHIAYLNLAKDIINKAKETILAALSPADIVVQLKIQRKGKLSAINKETENSEDFREVRRKHSAVESSINALENHGLDRCRDHGIKGFKRYVGLAVLARNIQIIGHVLQQKKLKQVQRLEKMQKRRLKAAA